MTATAMRTHRCGALRRDHVGAMVRLAGWVHRRRDLGGLVFFDLRDRDGLVQVAFDPDSCDASVMEFVRTTPAETVVQVEGEVRSRPEDQINRDLGTGEVEVRATVARLLGRAPASLPIPVWRTKGEPPPSEELRLKYRYLDLRRPELHANLVLRHRLLQRARRALSELGFLEIETPILTKPTPEGARDFLVPSSVHRGEFYALPQSPQIYKQLLMVSGFDRYFQLARCFRDEDLRHDRQPEFTQIDLEASFVSPDDVYDAVESVLVALWDEAGQSVDRPFRRIEYREAMERYGSDKPDLRYGYELTDVSDAVRGRGFRVFDEALGHGGRVRGIRVPGGATLSRKDVDRLTASAKQAGASGLATVKRAGDQLSGPLAKLDGATAALFELEDGALLLSAAGSDEVTGPALAAVRQGLVQRLAPPPVMPHAFAWIVDFPLFEPDPETGALVFAHHPFTAPRAEDLDAFLHGERAAVRAYHYDVVYNGYELGSGSIRITDHAVQMEVFRALGMTDDDARHRFGFLLDALAHGAPPHGGFALGFDRIVMLLAGAVSLREVIAFPKTTAARALFEDAPTTVPEAELRDLGITTTP